MNLTSPRNKAAAGFFAAAALGLAACSPPGQVDSAQKVDTATSQDPSSLNGGTAQTAGATSTNVADASAASASANPSEVAPGTQPVFRNCGNPSQTQPARVLLACADQNDFLEDVTWSQWGEALATGTGTRVTVNPDRRVEDIEIILGDPQLVDGELQFTTVTVDGAKMNPESNLR